MNTDISYDTPVKIKNYFLSRTKTKIFHDIIDVKIVNIIKLKDGFLLSVSVDKNTQEFLKSIDDESILELLTHNQEWFNNNLKDEEIVNMFHRSYCEQSFIMNVYLKPSRCIQVNINNKEVDITELLTKLSDLSFFKQNTVNIRLQLIGMYIYTKQTHNKWCVHNINIYENTEDAIPDSKDDIEIFWKEMISKCNDTLDKRIKNIEGTKNDLQKLYIEIQKSEKKVWDEKIMELKKLVQNILY